MDDTARSVQKVIQAGTVSVLDNVVRDRRMVWKRVRGGLCSHTGIYGDLVVCLIQEIGQEGVPDATVGSGDCNTH